MKYYWNRQWNWKLPHPNFAIWKTNFFRTHRKTMAQLFNRIGQIGVGLALAGGVVNSALYNGLLLDIDLLNPILCSIHVFIQPFSRWWTSGCHIRSIPGHQTIGGGWRNPFLHSMGPTSHHIRYSIAAKKCASGDRQQGLTKRQHHIAYPVPTGTGSIAENLYHSWCGLWWSCVAVNHNGSAEGCRCAIRCWWIDYTERGNFSENRFLFNAESVADKNLIVLEDM